VLVSVITNIDYDHMNWLGRTKAKIAAEKAGIIKPGVPLVTGARGQALRVIKSVAKKRRAPVTVVSGASHARIPLAGRHQKQNAAIAIAALRALNARGLIQISQNQLRQGLARARWPGRFERIRPGIILDGAHNPAGCRTLVRTLKEKKLAPVNLMFGALDDKDFEQMARVLAPAVARCVTVPVPSDRSASPATLARLRPWRTKAEPARSIEEGWKKIRAGGRKRPIVIAGSLYLVGKMRRRLK
jgi:dihydrofolate synthase/folylpolyglutamate synthase